MNIIHAREPLTEVKVIRLVFKKNPNLYRPLFSPRIVYDSMGKGAETRAVCQEEDPERESRV